MSQAMLSLKNAIQFKLLATDSEYTRKTIWISATFFLSVSVLQNFPVKTDNSIVLQ